MNRRFSPPWRFTRLLACAVLTLLVAGSAFAQFQVGNVFGTVVDNQGQPLPGVTVTLSGIGAPKTFVTDSQGNFRFLSLDPGRYTLKAELQGFGTVTRSNVDVNASRNTTIEVSLAPALEQTITVTAETPLLDTRKTGTGAVATEIELQEIPTARDPWVIMQQVPGVLMDRINVGGNESGQQSNAVGKGANRANNTWNIDGVDHTDMAATGASAMYYDFDSFQEMQVTTGTSDVRVRTPGIQMNLVTKRGTNDFRGSGRFFLTDRDFQADPEIPEEARGYLSTINQITEIKDYGAEVGGPIMRDRLWFWGSYGTNEIDLALASGARQARDYTELKNWSGKLNAQITSNNSATGLYSHADKIKLGRNVSVARPPESAWNQDGPTPVYKIEDTHIFSPNFYLTGLWSYVGGGFNLVSATLGPNDAYWENGVWRRGYISFYIERPQDQYRLDASTFFDTGNLNHELKFGFGYRDAPVQTLSIWPGNGNYAIFYTGQCADLSGQYGVELPSNCGTVYLTRDGDSRFSSDYKDLYVGDTMLWGNLTVQAGLRYDMQAARNDPASAPANSLIPNILGGGSFAGDDRDLEWDTITPRIGATYSLGSTRRTILRAAYNQYVDQLASGLVTPANPVGVSAMAFVFEDRNGNKQADAGEVRTDLDIYDYYGLDPNDPSNFAAGPFAIDYDMDVPRTDEIVLGVEQELMPEFTVGATYTHRQFDDFIWTQPLKADGSPYTVNDYELAPTPVTGTHPDGSTYSLQYYRLKPGIARSTRGLVTNRPGYEQSYDGIELTATKRLSNRWMMRGNISWNDWKQEISPEGFLGGNPSQMLVASASQGGCSSCDGPVLSQSAGSGAKGNVFINSSWSYNFTALYQLPWQINLGASFYGWEGYPVPYVHTVTNAPWASGTSQALLVDGVEGTRNEDIMVLDLRLAKEFRFQGVGLTISADLFNATDERPVMQRNRILYNSATARNVGANRITEIQSPRVYRLGARLTF